MSAEKQAEIRDLQGKAIHYFCDRPGDFPTGRPYNCCESVLLALAEHLQVRSDLIPRIGTAVGAGVGLNGLLCGCISSVAMATGIRFGRASSEESPKAAWDKISKYVAAFNQEFGAINCGQLTGLNLRTPEGLKEYYARVHDYECTKRLKFAVERGIELLSE